MRTRGGRPTRCQSGPSVTQWATPELVDEVLAECRKRDRRPGALPAGFMVYFTLGLALFHQNSYDDVAEHLVGGVPELSGCIPHKASFTRARERLGPEVVERLFHRLAGPLALTGLTGSFCWGMCIAAVDGFLLDVPDNQANRQTFGGPKDEGPCASRTAVLKVFLMPLNLFHPE
ncbi:transposase domain-containing protein [Streptomyces noursei]|uniref:transposase domain-containing protein n=1 Tax=Streptomyces noursei TaxID=1971 RepID=UPI0022CABF28|nr:transposase domain-containing protein [Streptomyces noursei]